MTVCLGTADVERRGTMKSAEGHWRPLAIYGQSPFANRSAFVKYAPALTAPPFKSGAKPLETMT